MNRYLTALGIVSLLAGAIACSSKEPTGPGNGDNNGGGGGGTGSGAFVVGAYVTEGISYVKLLDTSGNPISSAVVVINGETLSYNSYSRSYTSPNVTYISGQTYSLSIDAGAYGTASATVTAPNVDSVIITSPSSGATFQVNSPIDVTWQYRGGDNSDGQVALSLHYSSPDTTTYFSGPLDGTTTSHTIPSSATPFSGDASISITAGNMAIINGLPDFDPGDLIDGSYFVVYTYDYVEISISDTAGGGTPTDVSGQWGGRWQSLTGAVSGCQEDTLIMSIGTVAGDGSFNVSLNGGCAGNFNGTGTALDYHIQMNTSGSLGTILYDGSINNTVDSMGGSWKLIYNSVVVDSGIWWVRKP